MRSRIVPFNWETVVYCHQYLLSCVLMASCGKSVARIARDEGGLAGRLISPDPVFFHKVMRGDGIEKMEADEKDANTGRKEAKSELARH